MYCRNCGRELPADANACPNCGAFVDEGKRRQFEAEPDENVKNQKSRETMQMLAKVFCIIGTVVGGFALIPLIWMVPMTVHYCQKIKQGDDVSLAFKILTLFFLSFLGGIFMLVDEGMKNSH